MKVSKESTSIISSELASILQKEGLIVFSNKFHDLPQLPESTIKQLFGEKAESASEYLNYLSEYFYGIAIGDSFGSNHDERRRWRNQARQKYGDEFYAIYIEENKFRANLIGFVALVIGGLLAEYAIKNNMPTLADALKQISSYMTNTIYNKFGNYHTIDSIEDKFEIVCIVDDCIFQVFQLLQTYESKSL